MDFLDSFPIQALWLIRNGRDRIQISVQQINDALDIVIIHKFASSHSKTNTQYYAPDTNIAMMYTVYVTRVKKKKK